MLPQHSSALLQHPAWQLLQGSVQEPPSGQLWENLFRSKFFSQPLCQSIKIGTS